MLLPITDLQYNPQNNTIRYLVITLGTVSTFYLCKFLDHQKRRHLLNLLIIFVIASAFTFSQVSPYTTKISNLDPFHDGEQLGVGSALYYFNKKPFSETFFLHGLFVDPLITLLSFNLFGPSIGALYFTTSLLIILSFIVLFGTLQLILKDNFLLILLSFYLIAGATTFYLYRDLFTFIVIAIAYLTTTKKINLYLGTFLGTFLAFFSFYYSIDRAYYIFTAQLLFVFFTLLYYFFSFNQTKRNLLFSLKLSLISLSAILLSNLVGLVFLGFTQYHKFLEITFLQLPKFKPFLDEYQFPPFVFSNLYPYWLPILIVIFILITAFYYIQITKFNRLAPFILFLSLLPLFYYRSAIGRSDLAHISYILHLITIPAILILYFLTELKSTFLSKFFIYTTSLILVLLPYLKTEQLFLPPTYTKDNLIQFSTLFLTPDSRWLTYEQQEVTNFVKTNTSPNDYLFVFTNESAYYYLTQRNNPSRFYTVWFASPNFYQSELLSDLQKNKPKIIIYKSSHWSNNIDNIPNEKRLPKITQWIQNNYQPQKKIASTEIWLPK